MLLTFNVIIPEFMQGNCPDSAVVGLGLELVDALVIVTGSASEEMRYRAYRVFVIILTCYSYLADHISLHFIGSQLTANNSLLLWQPRSSCL